jgi:glycosyltransferase involved in cell wall biosynthesis
MRLAVSAEFIRPGRVGGTEQALHYMVDGLTSNLRSDDSLTVFGGDSSFVDRDGVRVVTPPRQVRPRFAQETITYFKYASSLDAYYLPNYFTPPGRLRCRTVTTIPDLQYLHLPENFSGRKRAWLRMAHGHTLRRAHAVTVYSESVREDIVSSYGARLAERVTVMPIPVSWERFGSAADKVVCTERPYALAVASHYAHKNLATLVRAFRQVHEVERDLNLVLAGQLGANLVGVRQAEDVRALVDHLGLGDVVRATGYVSPTELGALYRDAALFVFPSLFEGFGLPPVEALGFGLPVITTQRTSLPEVTLGLADYVDDPYDAEELAALMLKRIEDGKRPSADQVAKVRAFYAPSRIGAQLRGLLADQS